MKLLNILLALIVAVGMASTALARDDKDLVAEGYRWVSLDGPYACPTKEDLRRITREPSDTNELHMVEQVRAYYLETSGLIAGDTLTKMGGVQGATDTPTPSLHGSAGGFRNPEQLQQNLRPVFELGYR